MTASADDFYLKRGYGGHFGGRTLIQAHGKIGGHRSVFVTLTDGNKSQFVYMPIGGVVVNPFRGRAKAYAGDLCEFDPDVYGKNGGQTIKILKYFELAKDVAASTDQTIKLVRDGYHHIPFVGDDIMVAPATLTAKGTGITIVGVTASTDGGSDVWEVTLGAQVGATPKKGDIFVEAAKVGANTTAMVTNPNAYFDRDNDFFYEPNMSTKAEEGEGARYFYTPARANEDTVLNLAKCNKLPPAILALNKSKIPGWFNL